MRDYHFASDSLNQELEQNIYISSIYIIPYFVEASEERRRYFESHTVGENKSMRPHITGYQRATIYYSSG